MPATLFSIIFGALAGIVLSRRRTRLSTGVYYYFIFGLTITLQIATTFAMLKVLNIYGTYLAVICLFIALRLPYGDDVLQLHQKLCPRRSTRRPPLTDAGFCAFVPDITAGDEADFGDKYRGERHRYLEQLHDPAVLLHCSSKNWTVPLTIYNFFGQYQRDWQYVFGALVLTILPMLILFLCL